MPKLVFTTEYNLTDDKLEILNIAARTQGYKDFSEMIQEEPNYELESLVSWYSDEVTSFVDWD